MGKALAGRAGGILAMILLVVTPMYLAQAHVLEAERTGDCLSISHGWSRRSCGGSIQRVEGG